MPAEADACFAPATFARRSAGAPDFPFVADDTPLHRKLGVFESRD